MALFEQAVTGVRNALDQATHASWGWHLRKELRALRVALLSEPHVHEGWLVARCAQAQRERQALLARIAQLSPVVMLAEGVEDVRAEIERLLHDAERHQQRVSNLIYDSVSLELGGSE